MNASDAESAYKQLISELKTALIGIGVPARAIAIDVVMRFDGRRQDADLLLLGDDGKTIVAQFEVRVGLDPFRGAIRTLRDMPNRHRCYVVTNIKGVPSIAFINKTRTPHWISLSDKTAISELLGDYAEASNAAITSAEQARRNATSHELDCFRWIVGGVGLALFGCAGSLEWYGHEFSWKIYALLSGVIALLAAASGYAIRIKVGENEISIEPKGKTNKE